jgi:multidrug efflux pump subunit AcrB
MSNTDTAGLRQRLIQTFSDEEVNTFCYDHCHPVYEQFSSGMTKTQKIHHLIEYCERRGKIPELERLLLPQKQTMQTQKQKSSPWMLYATIIGLIASLITIFMFVTGIVSLPQWLAPKSATYTLSVRVQNKAGKPLPRVNVSLDIPGSPPFKAVSSSSGVATFDIASEHAGKTVHVIINEDGYEPYDEPIEIKENAPTFVALLEPAAN